MGQLDDLWSEKDLIVRLNLKAGKKGTRSATLGTWIRNGLPYYRHSDRRFFKGADVMKYMEDNLSKGDRSDE